MKKLLGWYVRLKTSERGATAVEYGILVALIAAAVVAIVLGLGGQIKAGFETVSDALTDAGIAVPE